jgi:hypothetical protein
MMSVCNSKKKRNSFFLISHLISKGYWKIYYYIFNHLLWFYVWFK